MSVTEDAPRTKTSVIESRRTGRYRKCEEQHNGEPSENPPRFVAHTRVDAPGSPASDVQRQQGSRTVDGDNGVQADRSAGDDQREGVGQAWEHRDETRPGSMLRFDGKVDGFTKHGERLLTFTDGPGLSRVVNRV
jgi:hypothetical protein